MKLNQFHPKEKNHIFLKFYFHQFIYLTKFSP